MSALVNPTSYFFNLYAVPSAIVSSLILATGIFVFFQNRRAATNISFLSFCVSLTVWLYGISVMYCLKDRNLALGWYRWVIFLGVAHIAPTIYTFSVLWLGLYEKQKRLVLSSFILALIFYLLAVATPYGMPRIHKHFWGYYPEYGWAGKVFLFLFFGYFFIAFYNYFTQLKVEKDALKRKQIKLIAIAFLISITGSIDYIPKVLPLSFYPVGFISVFAWILIVAYMIVRYRVMDIQTVIHKSIMWTATSSLFVVPLAFFFYLEKDLLVNLKPISFSGVFLGLAVLFILYARFVQPKIDHLFQRKRWDLAQVFEKFTDELIHLRGLDDLCAHIVETIRKAFYVERISLLLAKGETSPFECMSGFPDKKGRPLDREDRFVEWLERKDVLVLREYLDLDPRYETVGKDAKEYFERTEAQLCVPLGIGQRLIGIINIGQKANLKPFEKDEINFLSDLRKTAAIALSNSLRSIAMQENLRRWNIELERKVEERTRELKETQSQLIQAEKLASIGTLAGGIAHEINNPLTAVLTNVQMLKMLGEIKDMESLSLIEEGAKRCQAIIQKLMRYARKTEEIETFQEVDVNSVIRNVCDFLGYQLKQENIELELFLSEVDWISGIPNELEQVFTNLILNSKDAIKAAGRLGKIRVKTEQKEGVVRIELSDNGIGIRRENLARIFDPFYTTKDIGEGTGLGLTITSGIVEKHLGKIFVTSEEGNGTTFIIQFPNAKSKTLTVKL